MPRKPRMYLPEVPAHVVQRGNNRAAYFFTDDDYGFYLNACDVPPLSSKHFDLESGSYCTRLCLFSSVGCIEWSRAVAVTDGLYSWCVIASIQCLHRQKLLTAESQQQFEAFRRC